jgi:hypothetical protein
VSANRYFLSSGIVRDMSESEVSMYAGSKMAKFDSLLRELRAKGVVLMISAWNLKNPLLMNLDRLMMVRAMK